MKVELTSGSALPRDKYDAGTIFMISHQVTGVSPELIEVMSPYEAMLHYPEGILLGLIVEDLMGVTLLEGLPMIIICTLVAPTQVAQIVEWWEADQRVGIVDPHPALTPGHPTPDRSSRINLEQEALQVRLEQVVRHKNEISQHLEQYATHQDCVLRLVTQSGEKLQQLETSKSSEKSNKVPSTPLPSHNISVGLGFQHQFQVKAEFDLVNSPEMT